MRKQKIIPFTGILPWKSSCRLKAAIQCMIGDDLVHLNESDIIFIASGVKHRLIAPDTGKRLNPAD